MGGGLAGIDRITDFGGTDGLDFAGAAGSGTNYAEVGAAQTDFAAAQAAAQGLMNGTVIYVAVTVGSDVVVFYDSDADNDADEAVRLIGRALTDIASGNII